MECIDHHTRVVQPCHHETVCQHVSSPFNFPLVGNRPNATAVLPRPYIWRGLEPRVGTVLTGQEQLSRWIFCVAPKAAELSLMWCADAVWIAGVQSWIHACQHTSLQPSGHGLPKLHRNMSVHRQQLGCWARFHPETAAACAIVGTQQEGSCISEGFGGVFLYIWVYFEHQHATQWHAMCTGRPVSDAHRAFSRRLA